MSNPDVVITFRLRFEFEPLIVGSGPIDGAVENVGELTPVEQPALPAAPTAPGLFPCQQCDRLFDSQQGVTMHVLRTHEKRGGRATLKNGRWARVRDAVCPSCGAGRGEPCLTNDGRTLNNAHAHLTRRHLMAHTTGGNNANG
jgi:hypothetical protein